MLFRRLAEIYSDCWRHINLRFGKTIASIVYQSRKVDTKNIFLQISFVTYSHRLCYNIIFHCFFRLPCVKAPADPLPLKIA